MMRYEMPRIHGARLCFKNGNKELGNLRSLMKVEAVFRDLESAREWGANDAPQLELSGEKGKWKGEWRKMICG